MNKKSFKNKKPKGFELTFQANGTLLIPAGVPESILSAFKEMVADPSQLDRFVEISQTEVVLGDDVLCG